MDWYFFSYILDLIISFKVVGDVNFVKGFYGGFLVFIVCFEERKLSVILVFKYGLGFYCSF